LEGVGWGGVCGSMLGHLDVPTWPVGGSCEGSVGVGCLSPERGRPTPSPERGHTVVFDVAKA
jgi:hypothetical protein